MQISQTLVQVRLNFGTSMFSLQRRSLHRDVVVPLLLMQPVCRLSQRWHQQFCRSAVFAGHQKCIQHLQPVRHYRQSARAVRQTARPAISPAVAKELAFLDSLHKPTENDLVIREYEQNIDNKEEIREIDPHAEINTEMAQVRAQMAKLERELAEMRQGPFGPQSELMQALPRNERQALLDALATEESLQGEEDIMSMAELEEMDQEWDDLEAEHQAGELLNKQIGVTLRVSKKDQGFVRHFNKALRAAIDAGDADVKKPLILWTWYLRCQQQIRNFSAIIAEDVWEVLWETQARLRVRPKHLVVLAKDMIANEVQLDDDQWMQYIESLQNCGDSATALTVWQEHKDVCQLDQDYRDQYWMLGTKLYSSIGRPLKAQELALNAIADGSDPRILVPVIAAWAKGRGPEALAKSWACYLKMRERLGTTITADVFEDISNAFLDADCADMALNVFKDMLLAETHSAHDSQVVYKRAIEHIDEKLQNATTEDHINHVGLTGLLVLPREFQNRFFFTSWIKKLIGEGRVDSAMTVVELMYERGVAPDAKPLNGIIGAWLRRGTPTAVQKAEKLAWAMIEARKDLAQNQTHRPASDSFRKVLPSNDSGYLRRAVFLRHRIPAATIETFSIMILYNTRRSNFHEAEKLTEVMTDACQIKPNCFIMNHWLRADLRSGKLDDLWAKYQNLRQNLTPDLETFSILWDAMKVQLLRSQTARAVSFPLVRNLFVEMLSWVKSLDTIRRRRALEEWSPELYQQIVRCFCLSMDPVGTLVALHGLFENFDVYPDDDCARLICGQAARMIPQEHRLRKRQLGARHKHSMAQVAEVLRTCESEQRAILLEQGAEPEDFLDADSEHVSELRLRVLTQFICIFLRRIHFPDAPYQIAVEAAAHNMDVDMSKIGIAVSTHV